MTKTALYLEHVNNDAKIIEFAGYLMPVQYKAGIKNEHLWTRNNCGVFDVSHMGQGILSSDDNSAIEIFLEKITPSDFKNLKEYKAKYTVLTNQDGGIVDDVIITKISANKFFIVFNAGCKAKDIAWIQKHLPANIKFEVLNERSLIAVQGPKAETVLQKIFKDSNIDLNKLQYMTLAKSSYNGSEVFISRLGYTGEDGFEISVDSKQASHLWQDLTKDKDVMAIGLGARDSLRLEMGYPLYSHDINDNTSPVAANLKWILRKDNLDCLGNEKIKQELTTYPEVLRVGISLNDPGIVREDTKIYNLNKQEIGKVTSGGFGPSCNKAIAQGYVKYEYSKKATEVLLLLRNNFIKAEVNALAFTKAKTKTAK